MYKRQIREQLDEETLAIYDLLKEGKTLLPKQIDKVKEVAAGTLEKLKAEKLRVERWRESRQVTAQVKSLIYDQLLWLPEEVYTDKDLSLIHI